MMESKVFRIVDFIHASNIISPILNDITQQTGVQFELIPTPEKFQRCSGPGSDGAMKWLRSVAPDVICLCSPSYLLAKELQDFTFDAQLAPELKHFGLLRFSRARCGNRHAVHCSYLVLPKHIDSDVQSIDDMCRFHAGGNISFVYNDDMSMSGLYVAKAALDKHVAANSCSLQCVHSGGHVKSLELLATLEQTACASIDICVLLELLSDNLLCASCARSIHSILYSTAYIPPSCPPSTCLMCSLRVCAQPIDIFPIQPFAISTLLSCGQRQLLVDSMLSWRSANEEHQFARFHAVHNGDYCSIPKAHRLPQKRPCESDE